MKPDPGITVVLHTLYPYIVAVLVSFGVGGSLYAVVLRIEAVPVYIHSAVSITGVRVGGYLELRKDLCEAGCRRAGVDAVCLCAAPVEVLVQPDPVAAVVVDGQETVAVIRVRSGIAGVGKGAGGIQSVRPCRLGIAACESSYGWCSGKKPRADKHGDKEPGKTFHLPPFFSYDDQTARYHHATCASRLDC